MKRILLLLAATLTSLSPATAAGQSTRLSAEIRGGSGYALGKLFPLQPELNQARTFSLSGLYHAQGPFAWEVGYSHTEWTATRDSPPDRGTFTDRGIDLALRAWTPIPNQPLDPWIRGGISVRSLTGAEFTDYYYNRTARTAPGYVVGGGIDWHLMPHFALSPAVAYTSYHTDVEGGSPWIRHLSLTIGGRIRP